MLQSSLGRKWKQTLLFIACTTDGTHHWCDGVVSCTGACMKEPPPDPQGRDHSAGPWQRQELLVKNALQIQITPFEERFTEMVPGCWTAVIRRQGGRSNLHQPLASSDVYPQ